MFLSNWLVFKIVLAAVTGLVDYPLAADVLLKYDDANKLYLEGNSIDYVSNVVLYKGETSYEIEGPNVIVGDEQKITSSDNTSGDQFGFPVSIYGDYAVCGATWDDTLRKGSAFIFKREGTTWIQQSKIVYDGTRADYDHFGWSVAISGDYVISGMIGNDTGGNNAGAAYIFKRFGTSWVQMQELLGTTRTTNHRFGGCVSIDGEYAIIGMHYEGNFKGHASIFKRTGETWTEQIELESDDGDTTDRFAGSVSISGNYAIVGAFNDNDNGSGSGSAYIYCLNGSSWSLQQKIIADDGVANDRFGCSVAINGDYALVGAYGHAGAGCAYIFKRDGTSWTQQAKLTSSDIEASDSFGQYVALKGDIAVISSPNEDPDNVSNAGSVYIFKRNGTKWIQQTKFTGNDSVASDNFGTSVALSDTDLIVGARNNESAYIYPLKEVTNYYITQPGTYRAELQICGIDYKTNEVEVTGSVTPTTSWKSNEEQIVYASDAATNDNFGYSIAIDGNYAIVGAPYEDTGADNGGCVYMYTRNTSTGVWGSEQRITASNAGNNDYFGISVSISGDYAIVGANGENSASGSVYIYKRDLSTGLWGSEQIIVASDTQTVDEFGFSVSISGDYAIVGARTEDTGATDTGAAYIYTRNSSTGVWGSEQKIQASDKQASDQYGYSVSISSDYAIVGTFLEDAGGTDAGAVYIYNKLNAITSYTVRITSTQLGTSSTGTGNFDITPSDGAVTLRNWGDSPSSGDLGAPLWDNASWVSLQVYADGTIILAGETLTTYIVGGSPATWYECGSNLGGTLYHVAITIVSRTTSNSEIAWGSEQKILSSDIEAGDRFGCSVSLNGDYLIVGAQGEDVGGSDAGAAYIYTRDPSTGVWGSEQKLTASDREANDNFGNSVSISGDYAIVGARTEDTGGSNAGAAYIFKRDGTTWSEIKKIQASDAGTNDQFGWSVSLSGDYAIVGAKDEATGGTNAGAAYIYEITPVAGLTFDGYNQLSLTNTPTYTSSKLAYYSNVYDVGTLTDKLFIDKTGEYTSLTFDTSSNVAYFSNATVGAMGTTLADYVVDTTIYGTVQSGQAHGNSQGGFGNNTILNADGTRLLITDPLNYPSGRGRAYIYHLENGSWVLKQTWDNPTNSGQRFADGACMNEDGTRVFLMHSESEKVYTYEYASGAWPTANTGTHTITPGTIGSLSLNLSCNKTGDVLLIVHGRNKTSKIYRRASATSWSQDSGGSFSSMGDGGCINGDGTRAFLGRESDSTIHMTEWNGSTWSSLTQIINESDTTFPAAMACDSAGDTLVVKAAIVADVDKAGIYERDSGTGSWSRVQGINGSTEIYGTTQPSISYDGTMVLVGSHHYDGSKGRVYLWQKSGGSWSLTKTYDNPDASPASNDYWGSGTGIARTSKGKFVIGFQSDDTAGTDYGSVYVYSNEIPKYLDFDTYNKLSIQNITPTSTTLKYGSNTYDLTTQTDIYIDKVGTYDAGIKASDKFALVSNTVTTVNSITEKIPLVSWTNLGTSLTSDDGVHTFTSDGSNYSQVSGSTDNYITNTDNERLYIDLESSRSREKAFTFEYEIYGPQWKFGAQFGNLLGTISSSHEADSIGFHFGAAHSTDLALHSPNVNLVYTTGENENDFGTSRWVKIRWTREANSNTIKLYIDDVYKNQITADSSSPNNTSYTDYGIKSHITLFRHDWNSTTNQYAASGTRIRNIKLWDTVDIKIPKLTHDTYNKLSIENITPTATTLTYDSNTYDIGTATDIYIEDTGTYEIETKDANTFALVSNTTGNLGTYSTLHDNVAISHTTGGGATLVTVNNIKGNMTYKISFNKQWTDSHSSYSTRLKMYIRDSNDDSIRELNSIGDYLNNPRDGILLYDAGGSFDVSAMVVGAGFSVDGSEGTVEITGGTYGSTSSPFTLADPWYFLLTMSTSNVITGKFFVGDTEVISHFLTRSQSGDTGTIGETGNKFVFEFHSTATISGVNMTVEEYNPAPKLDFDTYNKLSISGITPTSTSLRLGSNTYDIGTATDIYIEDTGTYEFETKDANTFALVSNVVSGNITQSTDYKLLHDPNNESSFPSYTFTNGTNRSSNDAKYLFYPLTTVGDSTTLDVWENTTSSTYGEITLTYPQNIIVSNVVVQCPSRSTVPNSFPQTAELFTSIDDSYYTSHGTVSMTNNFPDLYEITVTNPIISRYVRVKIDNNNTEGLARIHVHGLENIPPSLTHDTYNKLSIENITPTSTSLRLGSNTYDIGTATDIYIEDTGTYEIETKDANTFAFASNVVSSVTRVEPGFASRYQGSMALTYDGKLYAWGQNGDGEAGVGTSSDITVPTLCTGITQGTVAKLLSGSDITENSRGEVSAIKTTDGKIYMAGKGDNYCIPGKTSDQTSFTDVTSYFGDQSLSANNVTMMSFTDRSGAALTETGNVWTWGTHDTTYKALGQASASSSSTPKQINFSSATDNITKITCGHYHTVALDSSGDVWFWGKNGINSDSWPSSITDEPQKVVDGKNIIGLSQSHGTMYAWDATGKMWNAGNNWEGQIGDGTTTTNTTGKTLTEVTYFSSNNITINKVYGGGYFVFADTSDGYYCWGNGTHGVFGNGSTGAITSGPAKWTNVSNIKKFMASTQHTTAITEDGKYYAWGRGTSYARGDNDTGDISYPKYISQLPNILAPSFEFDGYDKVFVYNIDHLLAVPVFPNQLEHVSGALYGTYSWRYYETTSTHIIYMMYNNTTSAFFDVPVSAIQVGLYGQPDYDTWTDAVVAASNHPNSVTENSDGTVTLDYSGTSYSFVKPTNAYWHWKLDPIKTVKFSKNAIEYDVGSSQIVTVSDPGTYDAQLSQYNAFHLKSTTIPSSSSSGLYTWAFHHGNFDNAYGDGDILTARDNGRFYADTPSYTGDIGTITPVNPFGTTQPTLVSSLTITDGKALNTLSYSSYVHRSTDTTNTRYVYALGALSTDTKYDIAYNWVTKKWLDIDSDATHNTFGTSASDTSNTSRISTENPQTVYVMETYWNLLFAIFTNPYYQESLSSTTYTFTPASTLTANVLMVAGGGSGGTDRGGGGGAGGLVYSQNESISTGAKTIVVGNGGGFASSYQENGQDGNDTTFLTYIAKGGGGGGSQQSPEDFSGRPGGSGGGVGGRGLNSYVGTSGGLGGTSTQNSYSGKGFGNSGGDLITVTSEAYGRGGGGGGAGSVGEDMSQSSGGDGGTGKNYGYIFGTNYGENGWFSGGGGGGYDNRNSGSVGIGGKGGGGKGGNAELGSVDTEFTSTPGLNHTGGGGGGSGCDPTTAINKGERGGSGIVLLQTNVETPNVNSEVKVPEPDYHVLIEKRDDIQFSHLPNGIGSGSSHGGGSIVPNIPRADGSVSNVFYATSSGSFYAEQAGSLVSTVEGIFYPIEQERYDNILEIGHNPGSNNNDVELEMAADGTAKLYYGNGGTLIAAGTKVCFTVGKWHHIALTLDSGGNAVGYVNGYPVVSGTHANAILPGSRTEMNLYRTGVTATFRKFLMYYFKTYNSVLNHKQIMALAGATGLGPKLEYDGLNAINVVNTEPGSGTEITIYESNVNDTSNLYVVSCNESSYLLSNAGTYYAQIKGTDTFTITRPLTVTDDHFPLYQYPPVVTGTKSSLTTSLSADTWNTWTMSGASTGNGQYKAKTSQATNAPGSTHATIAGLFTNGIKNDTITEGGTTHYNMLQTSSATTCDLTLQLPSAKIIRKYVLYPTDTNAPTSPYEPGSSVDPTLPSNGDENSLRRPKSWVLKGSNDDANWTDLDTVTNQPPSIYGDIHSISSPASYQYYKLSVTANNGSTERLQLGEWQLWGDA